MFEFLKRKSLASALNATRRLRIKGVVFEIQKISPAHFMEGGKVMRKTMDTYKTKGEQDKDAQVSDVNWDKVKSHMGDVILAGVVNPKLSRKENEDQNAVWIDKLFTDWEMCNQLYEAIVAFTYGKKKLMSRDMREQS